MPRLNRLASRSIDALRKDGIYADGGGLYVRVRGAAKHFLFIYQVNGKRREMGLGAPPSVGIKLARDRAQAARELLAEGRDPIAQRRTIGARPTFGLLADEWVAARRLSVRNVKSIDRWNRTLGEDGYAARLRPLRVDQITTEDVLATLRPIWQKGPTATLARGYIEAVLDAGKAKGLRAGDNPARWKGHLDQLLVRPSKLERGHHAALPYGDVPGFMCRLRARETVVARMVEFTILTAARSGEALGVTWKEIDIEKAVWILPATRMKAGRQHIVPLSERALAILTAIRPEDYQPDSFVFGINEKPPSNMAGSMLLRRDGLKATLHGFRSSFRDWAGDCTDFPREVAEAALAHVLGGVESAYRRGDALNKRRQLMEAWSRFCAEPAS